MVKGTGVEIQGLRELERMLETLETRALQKRVLTQGCRLTANKYLHKRARANLKQADKSGLKLEKHVKVWPMKKTWRAGVWIGYRPQYDKRYESRVYTDHGGNKNRSDSLWAIRGGLWLEHGALGIGRHGRYRGIKFHPTRATGWFRKAIDETIHRTEQDFGKFVGMKINAHIDKSRLKPARMFYT